MKRVATRPVVVPGKLLGVRVPRAFVIVLVLVNDHCVEASVQPSADDFPCHGL